VKPGTLPSVEILREEFLKPLGVTQVEFAAHIGVPLQPRGQPGDGVAVRRDLGTTAELWINIQAAHDLAISEPTRPIRRLVRTG